MLSQAEEKRLLELVSTLFDPLVAISEVRVALYGSFVTFHQAPAPPEHPLKASAPVVRQTELGS